MNNMLPSHQVRLQFSTLIVLMFFIIILSEKNHFTRVLTPRCIIKIY